MSATEARESAPFIDYENIPAPKEGILVTWEGQRGLLGRNGLPQRPDW
jgi:hypothetical protein